MNQSDITARNQQLVRLADDHDTGLTRAMAADHLRCSPEQAGHAIRTAITAGLLVMVRISGSVRYCRPGRELAVKESALDLRDAPKQIITKAGAAARIVVSKRAATSVFVWAQGGL